jgi:drug/metabolite transporter superfamily protein YnfA
VVISFYTYVSIWAEARYCTDSPNKPMKNPKIGKTNCCLCSFGKSYSTAQLERMPRLLYWILVLVSYSGVFVILYFHKSALSFEVPIKVELNDGGYHAHPDEPNYLCWISPDEGVRNYSALALDAPKGCDELAPGFITRSYVGHQFLFVYYNNTIDDPPRIVTMQSSVQNIDITGSTNYDTMKDFDLVVEWQRLLLSRRHLASAVAAILLIHLLISGAIRNQPEKKKNHSKKGAGTNSTVADVAVPAREPFVHRQVIKCYAVVNMIVDHVAYALIRDNKPLQTWFTIWADAGGSMHLFNWLVGYNVQSSSTRNSEISLLAAFLFLNTLVELPRPITYETLLSICLTRWLLQTPLFRVSAPSGTCALAKAPIVLHALLICAMLLVGKIVSTEGLKLVHMVGVLYAVNGRLFAVRDVDTATRLLWLVTAVVVTILSAWYNFHTVHAASGMQYAYGAVFVTLTLLNAWAVNGAAFTITAATENDLCPVRYRADNTVGAVVRWVAHHSLELYVGHFLLLKVFLEAQQRFLA